MDSHFGQWLKAKRQELGLSAYRLALQTGLSRNYISLIEHGKRFPADEVLVHLADALGIGFDEIKLATFSDRLAEDEQKLLAQWLTQEGKLPSLLEEDPSVRDLFDSFQRLSRDQKREALKAWQHTVDTLLGGSLSEDEGRHT